MTSGDPSEMFANCKQNRRLKGATTMKILKQKPEPTGTISIRVPASLKTELDALRMQCNDAGFDLGASLTEALVKTVRQIHTEIAHFKKHVPSPAATNGMEKLN
jgi:hypothetical protein